MLPNEKIKNNLKTLEQDFSIQCDSKQILRSISNWESKKKREKEKETNTENSFNIGINGGVEARVSIVA